MASCDIPDIALFKDHYQIEQLHFSAGMESTTLHLGMWLCSWLVRVGIPLPLLRCSRSLLKLSHLFDIAGTDCGGMHMLFKGKNTQGKRKTLAWYIIAKQNHGLHIPASPSVLVATKLLQTNSIKPGAQACTGLIDLTEYIEALSEFDIQVFSHEFD
jgi:hypothetical protein